MVDQPVTIEKLINADKDVQVIEDFIKKPKDETVTTRFGDEIMTLKGLEEEVKKSGGYFKRYTTLAAANADLANIPVDAVVKVTSEADGGDYEKVSAEATTLTKSAHDPLTQANQNARNVVENFFGEKKTDGYYTGDSPTSKLTESNSGMGFVAQYSGVISSLICQTAGGASQLKLQVYERFEKGLKLKSSVAVTMPFPNSEVLLQQPVHVKKGQIISLVYVSGAYIRAFDLPDPTYPSGSIAIPSAASTIGQVVAHSRSNSIIQFRVSIQHDSLSDLSENFKSEGLSELALAIGSNFNKIKQTTGQILETVTSPGGNTHAYGAANTAKKNSLVSEISFTTRTPSGFIDAVVYILNKSSSGFTVSSIEQVRVNTNSSGVATISGSNLKNRFVASGGYVLVSGVTTFDAPLGNTTVGSWSYVAVADLILGSQVSVLMNTSNSISLRIVYDSADIDLISNSIKPPVFSKIILNEMFNGSSLPSNWSQTGGWTVNNGLKSPAVGGWTTVAKHAQYSAMAKRVYRAKFLVSNISSVFGICTAPIEANAGSAVAMVDGVQNKLIIYSWDGSNAGTQVTSVDIPALITGRNYYLQVEKNGYYSTVTLTDVLTQQSSKVEYSSYVPYVQFHGQAGVIFISGDITVKHFNFNALYPEKPHAIIIGDSNSERAANVLPNETWAFKFAELRKANADVIVAGRSGDETPNFLKRKQFDLLAWQPKYVVWALGTNDTSQATWRTNMTQNIADTVALGAEPILVTQIPRTDSQALRTAMNDDIRNGYFGNYRYVDFAKAVSLNSDGVAWDPLYNSGDNVHVNPAGQQKLLQQFLADAPDLLY